MSAPKVRRIKVNLLLPMISSNPAECGTRFAISEVRSNRDAWRCADRSIASSRPLADPGQVSGWIRVWDKRIQCGLESAAPRCDAGPRAHRGNEMRAALGENGTF